LSVEALKQVGSRPLIHGLVLWVLISGLSLGVISFF